MSWNKTFDRARQVWFFDVLRIYPLMINYVSKDGTYFKEEKTFQNRGKPFQNQQNIFLIVRFRNDQGPVSKVRGCVRDRPIFERFLFLKKTFHFLERVLKRILFWKIFQ